MGHSILCGLGLGGLSALMRTLYLYIMCATVFLPVADYTPISLGATLLMGGVFGALFALLFIRFSRPHSLAAFCLWRLSAVAFSWAFVPTPDDVFFAMSGYEYHMGGGGGFAFLFALGGFLLVYLPSLLLLCLFLWDKIPPFPAPLKRE